MNQLLHPVAGTSSSLVADLRHLRYYLQSIRKEDEKLQMYFRNAVLIFLFYIIFFHCISRAKVKGNVGLLGIQHTRQVEIVIITQSSHLHG